MKDTQGRATISLTADANSVVDYLCTRFELQERMDAAKIGFGFAVATGIVPSERDRVTGAGTGTTWGIGSFDRDGSLRALVTATHPDVPGDPYVLIEALMNRGLLTLRSHLEAHPAHSLNELISVARG
jgi:hypothetical protein